MNKEQVDYLKKSLRHIIELIEDSVKDEKKIVIDKLGKWRMRNGEIVDVIDLNGDPERNPVYPNHIIWGSGKSWKKDGSFLIEGGHRWDLVEFISPPEFTEEGLYEMANGENIELSLNDDSSSEYRFTDGNRLWNKFGKRHWSVSKEENEKRKLIRYLGKKPFSIDKPGVYENTEGTKVYFTSIEKDEDGEFQGFYIGVNGEDGYDYFEPSGTGQNCPDINKFISPTWNFEKGEPA